MPPVADLVQAPPDRRRDLGRILDPLAVAAARLGDLVELGGRFQVGERVGIRRTRSASAAVSTLMFFTRVSLLDDQPLDRSWTALHPGIRTRSSSATVAVAFRRATCDRSAITATARPARSEIHPGLIRTSAPANRSNLS